MIELIFEFCMSCFVCGYLLYFYSLLASEEWKWKKSIFFIFVMGIVQTIYERNFESNYFETFLYVIFFLAYSRNFNIKNIVCAFVIDGFYETLVPIILLFTVNLFSFNVQDVLVYGRTRIIFCIFLHTIIIFCLFISVKPLSEIKNYINRKTFSLICLTTIFINSGIDYIHELSKVDSNFKLVFYVLILGCLFYYLLMKYCITIKKNMDLEIMNKTMQLTNKHVEDLEAEHEEIRKLKHDMKNQLRVLYELQTNKHYDKVEHTLKNLVDGFELEKTSISGNIYVDAILRQKKKQYNNIYFNLDIILAKDFFMDGKDIISLLSNLIDNACEELNRINETELLLTMKGNNNQLTIHQTNACRKNHKLITEKDRRYHGYGLRIIDDIVNKYDGAIERNITDKFECKIFLLF